MFAHALDLLQRIKVMKDFKRTKLIFFIQARHLADRATVAKNQSSDSTVAEPGDDFADAAGFVLPVVLGPTKTLAERTADEYYFHGWLAQKAMCPHPASQSKLQRRNVVDYDVAAFDAVSAVADSATIACNLGQPSKRHREVTFLIGNTMNNSRLKSAQARLLVVSFSIFRATDGEK